MINPKITVGIPNFNGSKYLKYAIDSVLRQSYTDFELIISDDGSTDDSLKIIQEYQNHPNVRIISSKENRGLSFRLNEQINMARGQYFCRMDSDDIMLPDRLKIQFDFLEHSPDVDIVGSAAIVIDENNIILGSRSYIPDSGYSRDCSGFIHPTVMGKTSFFRKNQYSDKFSGAEDSELWIRCKNFANFKIINKPLLFYRDPLKLRVATYISRLTLIEKLFKESYLSHQISRFSYILKITKLKHQKLFVRVLNLLGATSIWVKRRNTKCTVDEQNYYQSIVDEETNVSHSN